MGTRMRVNRHIAGMPERCRRRRRRRRLDTLFEILLRPPHELRFQ